MSGLRERRGERDEGEAERGDAAAEAVAADEHLAVARAGRVEEAVGEGERHEAHEGARVARLEAADGARHVLLHRALVLGRPAGEVGEAARGPDEGHGEDGDGEGDQDPEAHVRRTSSAKASPTSGKLSSPYSVLCGP